MPFHEDRGDWGQRFRTALVYVGGFVLLVLALIVLIVWAWSTRPERVADDLRQEHEALGVPHTWQYVGEEQRGNPDCFMADCLQVTRQYLSDLAPEHADACPWARRSVDEFGTVVPRNVTGAGCSVAAHDGGRRLVISISPGAQPYVDDRSSRPSRSPVDATTPLTVRLECCR